MKFKKEKPSHQTLELALEKIARLGDGIRADTIDWDNIGKTAKHIALEAIAERCPNCKREVK